jgi:hypothetical protein
MMLLVMAAWADPAALRMAPDDGFAVTLGSLVSAAWHRSRAGVAAFARLDGGAVGLVATGRRTMGPLVADGWAGPVGLPVAAGAGVHVGGSLAVEHERDRLVGRLGVVVPVTVAVFPEVAPVAPVLLEGAARFRVGPLWIGGHGALGTIVNAYRSSVAIQGGLVLATRRTP